MAAKFILDGDKVTVIHDPKDNNQWNFSYWLHRIVPDSDKLKKGYGPGPDGIKWDFSKKYFDAVLNAAERYYCFSGVTVEALDGSSVLELETMAVHEADISDQLSLF